MNPRYPIFIPSKGRSDSCLTPQALDSIGVPYTVFVEQQDFDTYAAALGAKRIRVVPHQNKGVVVTRNYIWDYAASLGLKRYWTMDDNIRSFYRFNRNLKVPVSDGAILGAAEDFTERYQNVLISGMNYYMFAPRKSGGIRPFTANTRVYSNMLIQTDSRDPRGKPYRWEGFFNEDTDLCLRILKDGYCTILFNAFLIFKMTTMKLKGGNTPYYQGDGRWRMAEELRAKHPDVTKITQKWGRWQHHVDYRRFKGNRLLKVPGLAPDQGVNDYGMRLRSIECDPARKRTAWERSGKVIS